MPRTKLPNRRGGQNISFNARFGFTSQPATALLGYDPRGRLAEVFLHCNKAGSEASILLHEMGIALSFALQHGCPLLSMREALPRDDRGKAEGPLGTLLDLLTEADIRDALEGADV